MEMQFGGMECIVVQKNVIKILFCFIKVNAN